MILKKNNTVTVSWCAPNSSPRSSDASIGHWRTHCGWLYVADGWNQKPCQLPSHQTRLPLSQPFCHDEDKIGRMEITVSKINETESTCLCHCVSQKTPTAVRGQVHTHTTYLPIYIETTNIESLYVSKKYLFSKLTIPRFSIVAAKKKW